MKKENKSKFFSLTAARKKTIISFFWRASSGTSGRNLIFEIKIQKWKKKTVTQSLNKNNNKTLGLRSRVGSSVSEHFLNDSLAQPIILHSVQ